MAPRANTPRSVPDSRQQSEDPLRSSPDASTSQHPSPEPPEGFIRRQMRAPRRLQQHTSPRQDDGRMSAHDRSFLEAIGQPELLHNGTDRQMRVPPRLRRLNSLRHNHGRMSAHNSSSMNEVGQPELPHNGTDSRMRATRNLRQNTTLRHNDNRMSARNRSSLNEVGQQALMVGEMMRQADIAGATESIHQSEGNCTAPRQSVSDETKTVPGFPSRYFSVDRRQSRRGPQRHHPYGRPSATPSSRQAPGSDDAADAESNPTNGTSHERTSSDGGIDEANTNVGPASRLPIRQPRPTRPRSRSPVWLENRRRRDASRNGDNSGPGDQRR